MTTASTKKKIDGVNQERIRNLRTFYIKLCANPHYSRAMSEDTVSLLDSVTNKDDALIKELEARMYPFHEDGSVCSFDKAIERFKQSEEDLLPWLDTDSLKMKYMLSSLQSSIITIIGMSWQDDKAMKMVASKGKGLNDYAILISGKMAAYDARFESELHDAFNVFKTAAVDANSRYYDVKDKIKAVPNPMRCIGLVATDDSESKESAGILFGLNNVIKLNDHFKPDGFEEINNRDKLVRYSSDAIADWFINTETVPWLAVWKDKGRIYRALVLDKTKKVILKHSELDLIDARDYVSIAYSLNGKEMYAKLEEFRHQKDMLWPN